MNDIRIFMCCHNRYGIIPPLCEPIQCGTALNPKIEGICHDNAGENISDRNREYCELTAHYFAWKNINADYYGFCHYRRFFCAAVSERPYIVKGKLSESDIEKLLRNKEYWQGLINEYEIIAPKSEDMGLTVKEHYCGSPFHYYIDLELFMEILSSKSPWLTRTAKKYLSQNRQYFCNMFIMDKKHFFEYCEWLFGILHDFDLRKVTHGNFQSDRTDGYLGELFTGIYLNYCVENGVRIKELPRLDVYCPLKKRISCVLVPSESKRRFVVKKLIKRIKGR